MNAFVRLPGETSLAYTLRKARIKADARDRTEPLITPEAERQAEYVDEDVMHIESMTIAVTKRQRRKSSLLTLHERGQLTADQYTAAAQIAGVAEAIRRSVNMRCASLEARVDCSGSSRNALIEHLNQVRLERAFSQWRVGIRVPRQLVVDMIVNDRNLKETARRHNVGWPRALRMLESALDLWNKLVAEVRRDIDQRDLELAHARLDVPDKTRIL